MSSNQPLGSEPSSPLPPSAISRETDDKPVRLTDLGRPAVFRNFNDGIATEIVITGWGWAVGDVSGCAKVHGQINQVVVTDPDCPRWKKSALASPEMMWSGGYPMYFFRVAIVAICTCLWMASVRTLGVPWSLAVVGCLGWLADWWCGRRRAALLRVAEGEHAQHVVALSRWCDHATLWRAAADPQLAAALHTEGSKGGTSDESPQGHFEIYPPLDPGEASR